LDNTFIKLSLTLISAKAKESVAETAVNKFARQEEWLCPESDTTMR